MPSQISGFVQDIKRLLLFSLIRYYIYSIFLLLLSYIQFVLERHPSHKKKKGKVDETTCKVIIIVS